MKKIISLSICLLSLVSFSQQTPQRNLYGYNKYAINPAYAGASGCTQINFSHLNQWVKVEGAPLTSMISANGLIGKSLGVGGQVLVDQIGMIQQLSAMGSLSYGLTIGKMHNIRLGASIGYNQYRIDASDAIAFENGDPIIEGGEQAGGTVNSNIGILYQWKNLEISVGAQQLIQSTSNMSFSGIDGFGLRRHLNGLVAYNQKIGDNWMLTPSIYTKGTNNGYQLDINADATYNKYISGGIGYRTSVGLIARAGIQVQDLFFIGYAYETPMSNIASYSSGSHEILLGIKFCKKKVKPAPEITEIKKEMPDTTDTFRNEEITKVPAMDTIVITRVDTVFVEKMLTRGGDGAMTETLPTKQDAQEEKKDFVPIEKNILFEFDKAVVQKGSFGALESIVNILNSKSELKISLKGHTDAQGPENYNVMLSKNRVLAVKDFLLANGISADRIIIEALGEKVPIADNSSSEGRKLNRRVEVRFMDK